MKIFSIYDSKVKAFTTPFFRDHAQNAIRGFSQLVSDSKTDMAKWPDDYYLYELGEFDEIQGKFINHDSPFSLGSGLQFKDEVRKDVG